MSRINSSTSKSTRVLSRAMAAGLFCASSWVSPALAREYEDAVGDPEKLSHADSAEHGSAHGHHVPHFSDINWFTGLVGEKEGVEPGLLWRPVGTPVPLGAMLINTAILFFLIGRYGGPAISAGLRSRKEQIAGDIERAAKMKTEAEQQLSAYEGKLSEMASEMARIKKDLSMQAESERERIVKDAQLRAQALQEDAKLMINQQLNQARQEAIKKAVASAIVVAKTEIEKHLNAADQERLARDLFASVESHYKATEAQS